VSHPPECEVPQADGAPCGRWVRESRPGEARRVALDDGRVLWACDRCVPPRRRGEQKAIPSPDGRFAVEWVDTGYVPTPPARGRAVHRNEPCPCGSGRKWKRCHGHPNAKENPR
jgi:hypothetical protein